MTNQDCLERAMFAASHSYSHTAVKPEDYPCDENGEQEENSILKNKEPVAALKAA